MISRLPRNSEADMSQPQRKGSPKAARERQAGVTLIEVLVSMLIMALGLVSLAALQTFTVRYQLGSVQRAQLSGLLSDYAERVRSNLPQAPGVLAGDSTYLLDVPWEDQAEKAPPAANKDCLTQACTPGELAQFDMAQWRDAVRRQLPQGSVVVTGSAVTGLNVTFMWSDKEFVAGRDAAARTSNLCSANQVGLDQQSCCPADVGAAAGVRCANFTVIP